MTKHVKWIFTKMKTVSTCFYFSALFIILPDDILVIPARHIRIKSLVTDNSCKFNRDNYIFRELGSYYQVCHCIGVKSGYSTTNLSQIERSIRMRLCIIAEYCKTFGQSIYTNLIHTFVKRRDSIGLTLYAFRLSHDGPKFFHSDPGGTSGMVAVHVTAKYKNFILFQFSNVLRCKPFFHNILVLLI